MIKRRNALDWRKSFVWEWLVDRAQPVVSQWNTSQVTTNVSTKRRRKTECGSNSNRYNKVLTIYVFWSPEPSKSEKILFE